MTAGSKIWRLSKAAREFNVGISTIVEFLIKKGVEIDGKPNTKIDPEIYDILIQEFQSEKAVKEESRKIGLSFAQHETISIDDTAVKVRTDEDEVDLDEIVIKDTAVSAEKEIEEIPARAVIKDEDKTVEIPAEPVAEKQPVKKAKKEAESKDEDAKAVKKEEEIVLESEKAAIASKKKGIKVLDKIDLDAMNLKTKPAKKPREAKIREAEKRKKAAQQKTRPKAKTAGVKDKKEDVVDKEKAVEVPTTAEVVEEQVEEPTTTQQEPKKDNFIPTKFHKLAGPTIIDKIDLPPEKKTKKKPVASSKDEKINIDKKKKRRRIRQQRVTDIPKSKEAREKQKGRSRRKERIKPELSEEEVQKQIKETLARLNPAGKSKASKYRRQKRDSVSQSTELQKQQEQSEKSILKVTEFVSVNELANMMGIQANDIISTCMKLGMFVSINQRLDAEILTLVAEEYGFDVEFIGVEVQEAIDHAQDEPEAEDYEERPPVVTIMGHVDHGKTKLLDFIRDSNVVAGEAGGITQHIGAYEVTLENKKRITFLDTPGHEAFTAMRARGAKITDIVIIVIAADDNIMPQTKEAINHAQAAGVPIIFAINKIDKPTANPEKIKEELANMNILVEDWGGKFQSQDISAKQGVNIDQLLEKVLLEAEMLELKGNPDRLAYGSVIESSLDKGRGYVAKLLVQNGTLRQGDIVLAGSQVGKVKAMYNERNQLIKSAGPSSPMLLLGLNGAPQAGDSFNVLKDERQAKSIANKRLQLQREQGIRTQKHITLDEIGRRIAVGDFKELNLIVKGDVDGSVEALSDSLLKLTTDKIQVNIIHKSVGQVSETDVLLASASDAIIIAFQVRSSMGARKLAEQEQIDIRYYSIIYNAIEEIKASVEGMLSPVIKEKITCNLEIREVYKITKVGVVAGCMVLDGKVTRQTRVRVIREGIIVYTSVLGSLKRFKDDVKEVNSGYECGLNIENYNDLKVGDIIEGYEDVEVKQTL